MSTPRTNDGLLRIVVIVLGALLLVPVLLMLFAMPMMGMMGWWWGGGMMNGASPWWGLGMTVLWLIVLVGIGYVLYRGIVGQLSREAETDPALEELRMAYARGDLTEEEFEERRENLRRRD